MAKARRYVVEGAPVVDSCLHLANVIYLASYLVRDILYLRLLTCLGLALGIVFFSCRSSPLYGPTAWHLLFLIINGYQIRRLVRDRRQMALSVEQELLGEAAFRDLSREELVDLLTHAMFERPGRLSAIDPVRPHALSPDEIALREIAFSNLSRPELLNLLTRRLWRSIARTRPARKGRKGMNRVQSRGRQASPGGSRPLH